MSRLPLWQKLLFGLAFLLPLACNLTTVEPTGTPFPTSTPVIRQDTATPTATKTVTPTPTKPAPPQPTSKPVYNLSQPVPAAICSIVPTVEAANIRSGPGTNFPVTGVMLANNWVMASRLNAAGWYQIVALGTIVNGGWISSTVVTLQQPCICTPDSCTQSGIVPPTTGPVTSSLPRVGFVGLRPADAATCIVTGGGDDVPVFSIPEGDPPQIAILIPHGGLPAFDYRELRYAVNFTVGSQQFVGWVNANRVTVEGDCAALQPPTVCSVQPSVGRIIDIYAEPRRDSKIIDALNDRYRVPFIQKNADGWFSVNLGVVGSGWIAPDEGKLVGPC